MRWYTYVVFWAVKYIYKRQNLRWHNKYSHNIRAPFIQQDSTEVRSMNHSCSGKAMSIIYSECVFVALFIQHAMRKRHIVFCGLSGPTKCFHVIW